jgi:methylmalonyl-CoA/ethylmalonyl-CoA epimerase
VIRRLDHLVLAVQSTTEAIDAWRHALDLPAEAPHQPERTHMQIAALPLDRDAAGAFLELVQPTETSHRVARFLADRGEGMFSVSLEVDDLDATIEALRARDLPVSDAEPGIYPNTRVARIPRASAHGVAVQLIERR